MAVRAVTDFPAMLEPKKKAGAALTASWGLSRERKMLKILIEPPPIKKAPIKTGARKWNLDRYYCELDLLKHFLGIILNIARINHVVLISHGLKVLAD